MMQLEEELEIPKETLNTWQNMLDLMAVQLIIPSALIMKIVQPNIQVFLSNQREGNPYNPGDSEVFEGSGLYCETVCKSKMELQVPNALKDPKWDHNPDIKLGMIAYFGFPLLWPNGEVFGTICILDSKENPFEGSYRDTLILFKKYIESYLVYYMCKKTLNDPDIYKEFEIKSDKALKELEKKLNL